jgi:prepilin-type N-terminal cleavage/methylation domain-containing protein
MKTKGKGTIRFGRRGLTLVELMVALMVTSIILGAVATLAYAMGAASDSSDDIARKQAQLRHATLRFSELLRHSRLICGLVGSDVAVWRGDDNEDGLINVNELVLIQKGGSNDFLRLCEFGASETSSVTVADIGSLDPAVYSVDYVSLIPQCSNVEFLLDTAPPYSRFLSISFDLSENDITRHYQLSSSVRSWAGHLLNQSGEIAGDDDEP